MHAPGNIINKVNTAIMNSPWLLEWHDLTILSRSFSVRITILYCWNNLHSNKVLCCPHWNASGTSSLILVFGCSWNHLGIQHLLHTCIFDHIRSRLSDPCLEWASTDFLNRFQKVAETRSHYSIHGGTREAAWDTCSRKMCPRGTIVPRINRPEDKVSWGTTVP